MRYLVYSLDGDVLLGAITNAIELNNLLCDNGLTPDDYWLDPPSQHIEQDLCRNFEWEDD